MKEHYAVRGRALWNSEARGSKLIQSTTISTSSCAGDKSICPSKLMIFFFLAARRVPTIASKIFEQRSSLIRAPNLQVNLPSAPLIQCQLIPKTLGKTEAAILRAESFHLFQQQLHLAISKYPFTSMAGAET